MTTICKKCCSLFLCAVLLCCAFVPAFASDGRCDCGFSPIIYVGPLGCTPIVRDAGTDGEQALWKIDAGFLLSNLKDAMPKLTRAILTRDAQLLADALVQFVCASFGDLALDSDGNSKENVTTPELNVPQEERHGIDCDYYFDYDFRLDPCAHADRLHAFIEQVKTLTGHDSVKLKCSSMGGVVLSAYLNKYGHDGIDVIICRCCPLWGTAVAGEAFCGKLELNPTAITRYGEDAIPFLDTGFADDFIEGSLYALLDVLKGAGLIDGICALGDRIIRSVGDKVFREALIPIFGTLPGIWAFVPESYFADAVQFMGLPAQGGLHDKVFAYRHAMANIAANLQSAREDGVKVCIICGYNVQRTPLVTLWRSTSDGTVDTKYASLGATCGDVKEPLDESYLNAMRERTYLSPDRMIDASTCALADCTWFVRDWLHCNGNAGIDKLFELVMTSGEVSVRAFTAFPQFLEADDDRDTVYPVTGAPDAAQRLKERPSYLNWIRYLFSFLKRFWQSLPRLFQSAQRLHG
ncbi:MAG: hypothetical protein IJT41_11750 [Clostridia bacterium]|nr:hypothetical protein [Clostridia bacterium]